jgi:hypothetical protein
MPALRQADWVAKDRVAAAIHGPCGEVLKTIALQPVRGWQLGPRTEAVPVPATRCCPTCGQLRPIPIDGEQAND